MVCLRGKGPGVVRDGGFQAIEFKKSGGRFAIRFLDHAPPGFTDGPIGAERCDKLIPVILAGAVQCQMAKIQAPAIGPRISRIPRNESAHSVHQ